MESLQDCRAIEPFPDCPGESGTLTIPECPRRVGRTGSRLSRDSRGVGQCAPRVSWRVQEIQTVQKSPGRARLCWDNRGMLKPTVLELSHCRICNTDCPGRVGASGVSQRVQDTQTVPGHLGMCCPDCPRRVGGIPDSARQSVQSRLSQRVGPAPTVQERRPPPRESWDTRALRPTVLGQPGKMHPLQHSRELLHSRLFRTLGATPDCPSTVVTIKKTLS